MKCEIDVDLGQLADEWEPVAFRKPSGMEWFITQDGNILQCGENSWETPRLIIHRRWKWPEWLTAEWIAMDMNGQWYGYEKETMLGDRSWDGGNCVLLSDSLHAFSPPPCTDWRQSKRRNPRAK